MRPQLAVAAGGGQAIAFNGLAAFACALVRLKRANRM
jgi:hypothetical protein